jgi:tRNA (guanine37-N1)-methyltransferase
VDQRVLDARGFEEVSVGDAVLAGGEAAAMVAIEACVRLIPGVLGQAASLSEESFEDGLLEHPQYTRPRTFEGSISPRCCCRRPQEGRGNGGRSIAVRRRPGNNGPDLWAATSPTDNQRANQAQRKKD